MQQQNETESFRKPGGFDLYDTTGKLDLVKCKKLARASKLTQGEAVATDEMVEIAEVVVPTLIEELEQLRGIDDESVARDFADAEQGKRIQKLLKAIRDIRVVTRLQKVEFHIPTGPKSDPIIVHAEIPMEDWDKVPEVSERISRIDSALEAF